MFINGKNFEDGLLIFEKDREYMEKIGSDMPFCLSDIRIEYSDGKEESIKEEIEFDATVEFHENEEIFKLLGIKPSEVNFRID